MRATTTRKTIITPCCTLPTRVSCPSHPLFRVEKHVVKLALQTRYCLLVFEKKNIAQGRLAAIRKQTQTTGLTMARKCRLRQLEAVIFIGIGVVFSASILMHKLCIRDPMTSSTDLPFPLANSPMGSTRVGIKAQGPFLSVQDESGPAHGDGQQQMSAFQLHRPTEPWSFEYYGPDERIHNFDPAKFSVFQSRDHGRPVRTRLFTEKFLRDYTIPMNECKHILHDGLVGSDSIEFVGIVVSDKGKVLLDGKVDPTDELWVIDIHHVAPQSCSMLEDLATRVLQQRKGSPWKILAVDYADSRDITDCPGIKKIVGMENYHFGKRSIVVGREWNEEALFPSTGTIRDQPKDLFSNPILHMPYPVRTDILDTVVTELQQRGLHNPLDTERTVDVAHFYRRSPKKAYFDNLRNGVNIAVQFLDGMSLPGRSIPVKTFVGVSGADKKSGRNNPSPAYVDTLLSTRIVVVSQRDSWVDHYRLLEAMVAGAMVVADKTQILPKGLRDGESVVVFDSFPDLREKLLYFLDPRNENERRGIAKRGLEMAVGYHRSCHVMESAIFGSPQTHVGEPYKM